MTERSPERVIVAEYLKKHGNQQVCLMMEKFGVTKHIVIAARKDAGVTRQRVDIKKRKPGQAVTWYQSAEEKRLKAAFDLLAAHW